MESQDFQPETNDNSSRANHPLGEKGDQSDHLKPSEVFQIPNGMVSKEYDFVFTSGWHNLNNLQIIEVSDLSEIGLFFITGTNRISGMPVIEGEFHLPFEYRITDKSGESVNKKGSIKLLINSDPRSLWKDIPTLESIEYFKPDHTYDFTGFQEKPPETIPSKNIIAASKRGRSHAHEGKARDDDFLFHFDQKSGWYLIAVADGAGSAKVSRKGSEIACKTIVEASRIKIEEQLESLDNLISDYGNEETEEKRKKVGDALYLIIGNAVLKAFRDIEDEAISKSRSVKDYSTTLLFTACKKYNFGWFLAAFWIGDGGIGVYNKETRYLRILGSPDSGDYAGQTYFLAPDLLHPEEIYRRLRLEIIEDFSALVLMTDGVSDPKFETDNNLNDIAKWDEFWNDISNYVDFTEDQHKTSQQLLSWLDFWSPGNHDDRTIAILY